MTRNEAINIIDNNCNHFNLSITGYQWLGDSIVIKLAEELLVLTKDSDKINLLKNPMHL